MTKSIKPGKALYTYSDEEVVWFHDDDHTPYNKRVGEVNSDLKVEVRAPSIANWIGFRVTETTTTMNRSGGGFSKDRTQSRTISFSMPREQFDAIVAHVKRESK